MSRMIFLNLPVRDLDAAVRFYEAIGCEKNPMFSTEQAATMVWSEAIYFQLLTHDYFASFSSKPIASSDTSEVLIALPQADRDAVDQICSAATKAGGRADLREPQDMGFMYVRAFQDLDGHVFEPMWMDPDAMAGDDQVAQEA